MSSFSDNEDDPAAYDSSGEEWDESVEKKRNKRRSSTRLSKKARLTHVDTSESSDSEEDSEEEKPNGVKRKKVPVPKKQTPPKVTPVPLKQVTPTITNKYTTGTFVINKDDAQSGKPNPPCIWKIDGKALLQKFEPFDEDGKVKHRNTSIYTGWSALDQDNYAPLQVQVYVQTGQKMIVEVDWDQLKNVVVDSE